MGRGWELHRFTGLTVWWTPYPTVEMCRSHLAQLPTPCLICKQDHDDDNCTNLSEHLSCCPFVSKCPWRIAAAFPHCRLPRAFFMPFRSSSIPMSARMHGTSAAVGGSCTLVLVDSDRNPSQSLAPSGAMAQS